MHIYVCVLLLKLSSNLFNVGCTIVRGERQNYFTVIWRPHNVRTPSVVVENM
uniref:Uncharacterized protein n=1 Tax=Anguilla anguilla TaxID=7936 RepID=A0A0E9UZI1_ANGAN